jgi:flagellar protein FliS
MFNAPSRQYRAYARYQDVDVAARVEGATPHALIAILFDELLKAIDLIAAADRSEDYVRITAAKSRALSLLHGLEDGLDFERGGEMARTLGTIYREGRRLLAISGPERQPALAQARAMIEEISSAWREIG